jgi:hypothetical protein
MKHYFTIILALFLVTFSHARAQFLQQGNKLYGTVGPVTGSQFQGYSVSVSADGNTAIVGAPQDSTGVGAAWVYTRNTGVWTQQAKLFGTRAVGYPQEGYSVSLSADGNTAIVGGPQDSSIGAAWVFTRSGDVWTQQGSKLVGTGAVGGSEQGYSVSISGDGNTAIVGGPFDNSQAGAAWVYTRSGGVWSQQGYRLVGLLAIGNAEQGYSVSLSADGNTAIVGGIADSNNAGAAWVYTRSGGMWSEQGTYKLVGTGAVGKAAQGASVSISADGNTAIVGGYNDSLHGFIPTGAAWVFTRSGYVWTQQGSKLVGTGAAGPYGAEQGYSVSISADGNTAIVGGPKDDWQEGPSSGAGAAWVYKRSSGVWKQQGIKLVGTGAAGFATQGYAVSISAVGNTAIVGGPSDSTYAGAAWVYNLPGSPVIIAIRDIPNDQGGKVRLDWSKSPYDNSLSSPQVSSYSIFRKSSSGTSIAAKALPLPENILMDSSLLGYDYVASVPAFQLPNYQTVVPTLGDSTSAGKNYFSFLVVAQTSDLNQYYVSSIDSGYSVDNIPPLPPAGIMAIVVPSPPPSAASLQVQLTWNSPTDPDVGSYSIYRSATNGFTPAVGSLIGTAHATSYADTTPVSGVMWYYRVIAVDVHGNQSLPSAQVSAGVSITQVFSLQNNWNMISVPLLVSDFTKTTLYPNAKSPAFTYNGSYIVSLTLANGAGYWLQVSGGQNASLTGFMLLNDSIDVQTGWNMIGSISHQVAVSSISSIPGGIVTSQFFGYAGSYYRADSIQPGQGYWVNVRQNGKLVLSSSTQATASSKIRIVTTSELPPPPPGESAVTNGKPKQFALEQNFPNPFNPTTIISYALPFTEHVTLKVYNMLGQEMMTLVNEIQDAGYKSVTFDANSLPSGVYTYRLTAGTFAQMKKMLLIK